MCTTRGDPDELDSQVGDRVVRHEEACIPRPAPKSPLSTWRYIYIHIGKGVWAPAGGAEFSLLLYLHKQLMSLLQSLVFLKWPAAGKVAFFVFTGLPFFWSGWCTCIVFLCGLQAVLTVTMPHARGRVGSAREKTLPKSSGVTTETGFFGIVS